MPNPFKNIYITGFMASGKTTAGKLLAQKLCRSFVDTDALIGNEQKKTITKIFQTQGESYFRQCETEVLNRLAKNKNLIVSLGGGAVMSPENQIILNDGIWLFIDTPFDIIKARLANAVDRPLAKSSQEIEALYKSRHPVYLKAHVVISGLGNAEDICQRIIQEIILK